MAAASAKAGGDVLIVDDDAILRDLVADWLEAAGYKVRKAADCEAARKALREQTPALIISDMFMPGACGAAAIGELKRRAPQAPVIAVSGHFKSGTGLSAEDAIAAGAELWVAGVEDSRHRRPDVARALRDVPDGAPVILMAHDPDLFPQVPARVALTVSGHLHGGQVGVPLVRRPFLPSRFGERYARGHKVEGGRHLFVTSGLGTTGWPVRLLAPPEIVILRLRPSAAPPRGPGARPRRGRAPSRAAGPPPSSAPAPRSR
jgi:CheY-like chemotaxis protein